MPLQPPESDSKAESPIQTLPDCLQLSREKIGDSAIECSIKVS
jgi:hypothetical protein